MAGNLRAVLAAAWLTLALPAWGAAVGPVEHTELPAPGSIVITLGNTVGAATVGAGLSWNGTTLTAAVPSVFGRTGAVTLGATDVTGALGFTPTNRAGDTMGGPLGLSTAATVSAAGTTQGGATVLSSQVNIVTTVAASAGVSLAGTGIVYTILNRGANTLSAYPPSGAQFESYGVNAPVGITPGGFAFLECETSTQCRAF